VLVYEPAKAFAGTATLTLGVIVNVPMPVVDDALKNLAAEPTGSATGYVTLFVGFVTQTLAHAVDTAVIVEAPADSVAPPLVVNCVDETVRFQPVSVDPTPLLSTVSGIV
jgi:hypothetical protein